LSELIKKPPNNPVAIGVNLEIGPKKEVKFIPAKDIDNIKVIIL
jgi:hypothetical protein